MSPHRKTQTRRNQTVVRGGGIISSVVNKAIDLLPLELHLPGYNYCGPGTNLSKRLSRGDKGINPLDEACKIHDIAYSRFSDSENRRQADKQLASKAWERVKASDSSIGERAAALAVTAAMKTKTALGSGKRKSKKAPKKGKGLYLKPYPKRGSGAKKKTTKGGGRVKKRCQKKKR